nr:prolyl 4-hydroxylase subunit alpha-2-like [Drosophila bipectinata]
MFMLKYFTFIVLLITGQVRCNEFSNTVPDKTYAASTSELMKLLEVEDKLVENLSGYVDELKKKLSIVEKSLSNLKAKHIQIKMDYETYLGNPLNSFSLIYRLTSGWKGWLQYTSEAQNGELTHIDKADRMRTQLPTFFDLQMASRGIDELMSFYKLKPEELVVGNLSGYLRPETALSSLDCYALGEFCVKIRKDALAEAWFNASLTQFKENNSVYNIYGFTTTKYYPSNSA